MLKQIAFLFLSLSLFFLGTPADAANCPSGTIPHSLTNGSPADAMQVMDNFSGLLSCSNTYLAPLASPHFTGSVGIGTTAPSNTLHVYTTATADGIAIDGTSSPGLNLRNSGTAKAYIGLATVAGAYVTAAAANDLVLRTEDATNGNILLATQAGSLVAMTVLRSGNVGIGTTAPLARLEINDDTNSGTIALTRDAGSARGILEFGRHNGGTLQVAAQITGISDPGGLTNGALYFYATNGSGGLGPMMVILGNGNVGIGTTSPAQKLDVNGTIRQAGATSCDLHADGSGDIICSSDASLKQNIAPYVGGLSILAGINPTTFQYRGEFYTHIGFIAQNVQAVLPQATPRQNNGFLGLDSNAILAASVNAIKQLKAANDRQAELIAQLETRLHQDEGALADIKARLGIRSARANAPAHLTAASYK